MAGSNMPEWRMADVSLLVREWSTGTSAANIGRMLGKSRNAVIGKVKRLGLPNRTATERASKSRPGQAKFRSSILSLYNNKCAITGTAEATVVEAAHIVPYSSSHDNSVANGICLRADLHSLFDVGLITITPALTVRISPHVKDADYLVFADRTLTHSDIAKQHIDFENLKWHAENVFNKN